MSDVNAENIASLLEGWWGCCDEVITDDEALGWLSVDLRTAASLIRSQQARIQELEGALQYLLGVAIGMNDRDSWIGDQAGFPAAVHRARAALSQNYPSESARPETEQEGSP